MKIHTHLRASVKRFWCVECFSCVCAYMCMCIRIHTHSRFLYSNVVFVVLPEILFGGVMFSIFEENLITDLSDNALSNILWIYINFTNRRNVRYIALYSKIYVTKVVYRRVEFVFRYDESNIISMQKNVENSTTFLFCICKWITYSKLFQLK